MRSGELATAEYPEYAESRLREDFTQGNQGNEGRKFSFFLEGSAAACPSVPNHCPSVPRPCLPRDCEAAQASHGPMRCAQASQAMLKRPSRAVQGPRPKVQSREASGFVVRLGAIRCDQVRWRWRAGGYTAEYREYADDQSVNHEWTRMDTNREVHDGGSFSFFPEGQALPVMQRLMVDC